MKTIDKMIIRGFIPPFIVTFFIALFVLTMQFLWVWVDELVGKGVGVLIILELLFYLLLSFFPIAFPIAVLLSSVMLMGGYAERYELSSMTSAGISLMRIMRPLVIMASLIGVLSFACSNFLWPVANLKYRSRLLDIKNQRPTLSIQKGVFNHDFTGFVIKVADKAKDDRNVSGIMIYDNQKQLDKLNLITAKKGEMYTEAAEGLFVIKMYDGHQYQEVASQGGSNASYPFVRTNFKEYTKIFDMSQFDFTQTDPNLYKTHQTMLSIPQLATAVDSIDARMRTASSLMMASATSTLKTKMSSNYTSFDQGRNNIDRQYFPSVDTSEQYLKRIGRIQKNLQKDNSNIKSTSSVGKEAISTPAIKINSITAQDLLKAPTIQNGTPLISQVNEKYKLASLSYSVSLAKSAQSTIELQNNIYDAENESRIRHIFEMNVKFAFAAICIVFLFIGAPMGAIVRKGGFGYPLLVAILFYMVYQVLYTAMKKSADSQVVAAWAAPWIPVFVMGVFGFILTRRAMSDSNLNLDNVTKLFVTFFNKVSESYYQLIDFVLKKFDRTSR